MIDWSLLKWTPEELSGIAAIHILPRVMDDKVVLQINWEGPGGTVVRQDAHVELLVLPFATGEAGNF